MSSYSGFMAFARDKWAAQAEREDIKQTGLTERQRMVNQGNLDLQKLGDKGRFARQTLVNEGNVDVANIKAGASKYTADKGFEGRKYASDSSAAASAYASDNSAQSALDVANTNKASKLESTKIIDTGKTLRSREQLKATDPYGDNDLPADNLNPATPSRSLQEFEDDYNSGNNIEGASLSPTIKRPAEYLAQKRKRSSFIDRWRAPRTA